LVLSGAGARKVTGTAVDLNDVAVSAVARWHVRACDAGLSLEHKCDPDSGIGWAAEEDVQRALDALIENALLYSPPGSTVELATAPGAIVVRDRGPGIREDELELVFHRFHRGEAGRMGPVGSGLGLAIARELAREWAGEVTLSPRPGGGLIAKLSLAPSGGGKGDLEGSFATA
jgi:signal transduction histidine kinase